MRVLVTGSRGFVGPWLAEHLTLSGDEVVELAPGTDVTDAGSLAGAVEHAAPEAICHLAAQSSVRVSWEDPAGTFAVNAVGTLNLCAAAMRLAPAPRVLVVSSAEVYGKVPPELMPVVEDQPFAPATPYASSKVAAEMVGLQAWLGRGLPVVRARSFNHTGPGQPRGFVVPDLAAQVAAAARGDTKEILTGNLGVSRDITDVRDVVRAYRLLLVSGEPGEAYNVCCGEATVLSDILARLVALAGVDVPVRVDPGRARPADVPVHVGSRAKLHALTGWSPEIPLDRTLAEVFESQLAAGASTQGQ
ncbi:MAG TPA: GDP-mannose 4,6-dehydratase [Acidimicrobiales bacterium]|nr:GDP-mannose 4,6-dehydratase [Acidimicrobiales bacterium]